MDSMASRKDFVAAVVDDDDAVVVASGGLATAVNI